MTTAIATELETAVDQEIGKAFVDADCSQAIVVAGAHHRARHDLGPGPFRAIREPGHLNPRRRAVEGAGDGDPVAVLPDAENKITALLHHLEIGRRDAGGELDAVDAAGVYQAVAAVSQGELVDIVAAVTIEGIVTAVAGQDVAFVAADQHIVARTAGKDVGAGPAKEQVMTFLPRQPVVAVAALKAVGIGPTRQLVVASEATDRVGAAIAKDPVVEGAAGK